MIIFGWRTRLQTLGQGWFFCPVDHGARPGVLLQAKRWFTLFFIPVIPLGIAGRAVQCTGCGTQFDERVLQTTDSQAVHSQAVHAQAVHAA